MKTDTVQMPLMLSLPVYASWGNVYRGENAAVVAQLQAFSQGEGEPWIFLSGAPGCGKTLLLQTVCQTALGLDQRAMYLSLSELKLYGPEVLEDLQQFDVLCLDDIQSVMGDAAWEEALFHLFNAVQAAQGRLLLAADAVPAELPVQLADLRSRWQWCLLLTLQRLSEQECIAALQHVAQQSGLVLTEEVAQFLLRRIARGLDTLIEVFERLNHASYAEQRGLTVPFVKQVLGL